MQSMKGLTREDAHTHVDKVCDMNESSDQGANLLKSMLSFRDFGSDATHNVIVSNIEYELL